MTVTERLESIFSAISHLDIAPQLVAQVAELIEEFRHIDTHLPPISE